MSEYLYNVETGELYHYGVKGMKWGVRRATRMVNSGNADKARKGVKSLQKHERKINKKIANLDKEHKGLAKQHSKHLRKTNVKAVEMEQQAIVERQKAMRRFTSDKKAGKRLMKAEQLEKKAKELKVQANVVKARIEKNEHMRNLYSKGLSDIDKQLAGAGRRYLNQ